MYRVASRLCGRTQICRLLVNQATAYCVILPPVYISMLCASLCCVSNGIAPLVSSILTFTGVLPLRTMKNLLFSEFAQYQIARLTAHFFSPYQKLFIASHLFFVKTMLIIRYIIRISLAFHVLELTISFCDDIILPVEAWIYSFHCFLFHKMAYMAKRKALKSVSSLRFGKSDVSGIVFLQSKHIWSSRLIAEIGRLCWSGASYRHRQVIILPFTCRKNILRRIFYGIFDPLRIVASFRSDWRPDFVQRLRSQWRVFAAKQFNSQSMRCMMCRCGCRGLSRGVGCFRLTTNTMARLETCWTGMKQTYRLHNGGRVLASSQRRLTKTGMDSLPKRLSITEWDTIVIAP